MYLTWTKLPCPPDPKTGAADQPALGKISSSDVKLSERFQFRRIPQEFDVGVSDWRSQLRAASDWMNEPSEESSLIKSGVAALELPMAAALGDLADHLPRTHSIAVQLNGGGA